ncbi:hypothetical protein ACVWW6_000315 [Bradyrhizobium sp. USDA 3311]|uniref:hypothetical protein n=1 Tax=Bradyrhizobium sp. CCBAU 11361 TaxID=1630812 RepID=UPI002303C85F|nr:hypothetical protein [Bradyrhizobium sp. CCBAU 11361]
MTDEAATPSKRNIEAESRWTHDTHRSGFAPKHSRPSIAGRSPNPLVELPVSTDQALDGVELVIVSHLHSDRCALAAA